MIFLLIGLLEFVSFREIDEALEPNELYECPAKPSGTVDDLSTNPEKFKTNSILYGCSLNIESRIYIAFHFIHVHLINSKIHQQKEEVPSTYSRKVRIQAILFLIILNTVILKNAMQKMVEPFL